MASSGNAEEVSSVQGPRAKDLHELQFVRTGSGAREYLPLRLQLKGYRDANPKQYEHKHCTPSITRILSTELCQSYRLHRPVAALKGPANQTEGLQTEHGFAFGARQSPGALRRTGLYQISFNAKWPSTEF